jgi:hypothetical protein
VGAYKECSASKLPALSNAPYNFRMWRFRCRKGINMTLLVEPPASTMRPAGTEPEPEEFGSLWIDVSERLPIDGDRVQVKLTGSNEIRIAFRGHYQSTGAWFDAATRGPIYDTITYWKVYIPLASD